MDAHHLYALTLCSWRRFDEGLAEAARAIELDPLSPVPSYARATCLWRARRYDDAIERQENERARPKLLLLRIAGRPVVSRERHVR